MRIRPALQTDEDFILGLAYRLTEFGPVPGCDATGMVARDRAVLAKALEQPTPETAVFVAEDELGNLLGFIHLTAADDYYTERRTTHIADVVVTPNAGGRGVGSALVAHAEEVARQRGVAMLTLNVFIENRRARQLYSRLGFRAEWIRCVKRL